MGIRADEAVKPGVSSIRLGAALHRPRSLFSDPLDREMLAVFILTCLATVGFGWLLSGAPHPSAGVVSALLSGGVGIWASVAVRFLLSE